MRILIAEDQPVAALYLAHPGGPGAPGRVAPDGEAAWRLLRDGEISLLISDWMMPQLDGLELCRRIRAVRPTATSTSSCSPRVTVAKTGSMGSAPARRLSDQAA